MSATLDTFQPDYVLAMLGTMELGEVAAREESEFNADTERLLAEITAPFDSITTETVGDFGDLSADLDELAEKYFH